MLRDVGDEMANIVNQQLIKILHLALKGLKKTLLILRFCVVV
jgi:hypothetical protein